MSHLTLRKHRMITNNTPFHFDLQAYYNRKKKTYSFPVCGDIVRRIKPVTLSDELKSRFSQISEKQGLLAEAKYDQAAKDDRLFDYQKSGVAWLKVIKKGILADDQGAGKTVTSLAAAKEINPSSVLVICSKTKRSEWINEILTWTGEEGYLLEKSTPDDWTGYMVTNYAQAIIQIPQADLVIIDEAHIIRNRKTQLFKGLRKIAKRAEYVFLLTASPTVNAISDFWPLLCICDEERFKSYWGFAFRFCEILMEEMGMKVMNTKPDEEENLRNLLNQYVLSRESTEDLPEPEWVQIDYVLSSTQRDLYDQMDKTMEATYLSEDCLALTSLSQITRLRQIALHPALVFKEYFGKSKLHLLPEYLEEWEGQTLIFSQYAKLAMMTSDYLNRYGISSVYLTSKLTDKVKAETLSRFKKGEFQVLALTYKLGGEGLNLMNASQVIFLEYAWNPASIRHAYKRVLRHGQTSDWIRFVIIHAVDTVEDFIRDILREKSAVTLDKLLERKND